ncbi:MAG: nucleoside-diphosphate kinase [Flavobacteriaceae bacterium]|nr:nucleoside-diphosphate kinase [Flavobacteriaceae bacterium]MCY4215576.1 nucleoside-diphosphate kinase [Flavobacteriaceae bacterium]MCY4253356.1 nucleoside-diphosphate kinase [Flavobacteriaceae bacterium]
MRDNQTFTLIKPDVVSDGHLGEIVQSIQDAGFKIIAIKLTRLSRVEAMDFYGVHKEKPFFGKLIDFMISGPIVPMILEKENAIEDFRQLIGATNPALAEKGTIREKFGTSITKNAIHGSDSIDNAEIEGSFYFSKRELFV